MASREGSEDGFPFLFETVLIFPFMMQAIFYTSQTCMNLGGFGSGFAAIKSASSSMGPCVFYACFITSTTLLETYSLQFIPPSTFVVLKQLTMVCIAIGEVLVFATRPSQRAWCLIFAQVVCVALFQYTAHLPTASHPHHHIPSVFLGGHPTVAHPHPTTNLIEIKSVMGLSTSAAGMTACLVSVGTGAFGSILAQRFQQKQAKNIPVSIKLLYQHVFELFLVMMLVQSRTVDRERLRNNGFFDGWNHWTCAVTVILWFGMLSGSAISANISAIAGAFAIAVSVALTGVLECVTFGTSFSHFQFVLLGMVCTIAMLYTHERLAMLSNNDPEKKKLIEDTP
jgi:hypothetical protein